jgi:hypothetical protein
VADQLLHCRWRWHAASCLPLGLIVLLWHMCSSCLLCAVCAKQLPQVAQVGPATWLRLWHLLLLLLLWTRLLVCCRQWRLLQRKAPGV